MVELGESGGNGGVQVETGGGAHQAANYSLDHWSCSGRRAGLVAGPI